jgi:hypothetical protein
MERMRPPDRPGWLQFTSAALAIVVIGVVYVGLLRYFLDVSEVDAGASHEHRDLVYLSVHAGVLAGAGVGGFLLGKWLNGLGVAYALLVLSATVVVMVGTQIGSQTLACEGGYNDLVRHWSC